MINTTREARLDEIFGYSGEDAKKLNDALSRTLQNDNYVCLVSDFRAPGLILHAGYANDCAFYSEFNKTNGFLTIKLGGRKENRDLAKRTLAEIGDVPAIN